MKKGVVADVLLAVLLALLLSIQTRSIYELVEILVILSFLTAEVLIILFARKWYTLLKWFGIILLVSFFLSCLPKAFVLASLNQFGYIVLLAVLFVVALFRTICSFLVKNKSN